MIRLLLNILICWTCSLIVKFRRPMVLTRLNLLLLRSGRRRLLKVTWMRRLRIRLVLILLLLCVVWCLVLSMLRPRVVRLLMTCRAWLSRLGCRRLRISCRVCVLRLCLTAMLLVRKLCRMSLVLTWFLLFKFLRLRLMITLICVIRVLSEVMK